MKKTELLAFGIPEEKIRAFNDVYWNDVRKQAARMMEEDKGKETATFPAALRDATTAMLALIDDIPTLQRTLTSVNRIYSDYLYKQRMAAECNQETNKNNLETTSATETATEGGTECQ